MASSGILFYLKKNYIERCGIYLITITHDKTREITMRGGQKEKQMQRECCRIYVLPCGEYASVVCANMVVHVLSRPVSCPNFESSLNENPRLGLGHMGWVVKCVCLQVTVYMQTMNL
jgi:hypothetical protein